MVLVKEGSTQLFFTSDTATTERLRDLIPRGCSLVHESSGTHAEVADLARDGHCSGFQAGKNAAEAGVRRLFLCHFSARRPVSSDLMEREAAQSFPGEIIVPVPFRWYEI
jgi:ribonuclease BN (tRNA processing enzyme)